MTTPESRSRELAAKATPAPWVLGWWGGQAEKQCDCSKKGRLLGKRPQTDYYGAGPYHIHESDFFPDEHRISSDVPECVQIAGNYDYEEGGIVREADAAYIAFHDPSLITAYADVVEVARELVRHPWLKQHEALAKAILALDALAKDRG